MPESVNLIQPPTGFSGWDRLRRPVWVFDPDSCRGVYANPAALELWGAETLDELLARDFSQLSPAVRARTDRLAKATAHGETVTERWTFYPHGAPTTVQAVISTLALPDGRPALLFEAAAATVQAEELRAAEALRHTSTLITLFDAAGGVLFSNPAAFSAYGAQARTFADRFSDTEDGAATLAAILDGEVLAALRPIRTAAGERFHHLDARRVLDPVSGDPTVLLSERDVTAQVRAERALFEAKERAEVAEAKERFLANMSHELRTPLTSVLGFAGLLGASALTDAQSFQVQCITEAGEALLCIINDVITLSELDSGRLTLDETSFDPAELVWAELKAIEGKAAAKGLSLQFDIADETPTPVIGDAERIRQVVRHYLSNALKFTDAGEITLAFNAERTGDEMALEVSVIDTGPGVTAARQAEFFQRFTLADDSTGKRVAGRGLGLAICKETVALMGGEVGLESELGEGSRFWFRLTLPLDATMATADAQAELGTDDEPPSLRVLFADDHESNRLLVTALLQSQGHRCDVVCDGAEAVAAVRAGAYDLVLMDIQMPVLDGVAATLEIRALDGPLSDIPIVALTANTLAAQTEVYAAAGMNDVIAKPIDVRELHAKSAHWGREGLWRRANPAPPAAARPVHARA